MAENLLLLKRRRKTAENIAQVAKALEMISASKIKRAQNALENNRPYAQNIENLTQNILKHADLEKFTHPYIDEDKKGPVLLLVVSSDRGLCGSFNTNLMKKIIEQDAGSFKILVLGKKAESFCSKLGAEIVASLPLGTVIPPYTLVYQILEIINEEYSRVSALKILFTEFQSVFAQEPQFKTILPLTVEEDVGHLPFVFEPNARELLSELLPYYLEVILYRAILEAFTSEQAARMVAMQNAKNNANDVADYLTLTYNKARQERITSELLTLSNYSF